MRFYREPAWDHSPSFWGLHVCFREWVKNPDSTFASTFEVAKRGRTSWRQRLGVRRCWVKVGDKNPQSGLPSGGGSPFKLVHTKRCLFWHGPRAFVPLLSSHPLYLRLKNKKRGELWHRLLTQLPGGTEPPFLAGPPKRMVTPQKRVARGH